MESTVTINCPQCGSSFSIKEGDRNARCASCSTLSTISGEAGISRYYLEERFDLPQSRAAARKALASSGIDAEVIDSLRFDKGELCFLPFWRLRGHVFGWIWVQFETITREEDYDENGRRITKEVRGQEEKTELVSSRMEYSSPACDLSRFGLKGIATVSAVLPLKGMQYEALSKRGIIFDPVKEKDQVRKEALAQARGRAGGKNVLRQMARLKIAAENPALIYYPVWSLNFSRGERLYPVVVDGVNGRVLKGRFPGKIRIRLFIPLLTVTLAVYAFTIHSAAGGLAVAAFLAWMSSNGGLSPERLIRHFFVFVERDKEAELG